MASPLIIHCLQHGAGEGPALIQVWAEEKKIPFTVTELDRGQALPSLESFDALVVMGGHMGVYEEGEYPWLRAEKAFLKEAIAAGKKILGVCLGSQLLAEAAGGTVKKGPHWEVGWHEVEWTDAARANPLFAEMPPRFRAFHWHGDEFSLPPGAELLASSHAYPHQAFQIGEKLVGVQFHPEVTEDTLLDWVQSSLCEIPKEKFVQRADEILHQADRLEKSKRFLFLFLDRFFS